MKDVYLEQWDAVELFCRVLSKFDKIKLPAFQNNAFLMRQLMIYSSKENCLKVTVSVFGTKANHKNVAVPKRLNEFYELSRRIRHSIPITLKKEVLEEYLAYLPAKSWSPKADFLEEWKPSDKQRKLEGTEWELYSYHEDHEERKKATGIAMAILHLKRFGKAEIIGYKPSECYTGYFSIYGKEGKYLHLRMKLKDFGEKDLHMLLYIGTGEFQLALGEYHNVGRSIYSGTVMVTPVNPKVAGKPQPCFHKEHGLGKLPKYVRDYFKDKKQNMLRVPAKVTSVATFYEWHKKKNKDSSPIF